MSDIAGSGSSLGKRANDADALDLGPDVLPKDVLSSTDDFAARRVPAGARISVRAGVVSGSGLSTAMGFVFVGGTLATVYGGLPVLTASAIVAFLVLVAELVIIPKVVREGININLMTRAVVGEGGSAYVSLGYGLLAATFFALEGIVMGQALSTAVPILPVWLATLIVTAFFIPLGIYGVSFMSKFQAGTLVLYAAGLVLLFVALLAGWSSDANASIAGSWWNVNPSNTPFDLSSTMACVGALIGLEGASVFIAATDTARLVDRRRPRLAAGSYSVFCGALPLLLGPALGVYLLAAGGGSDPNPGSTITVALGALGVAFVWLTQFRVNIFNTYIGSLAFANAFGRLIRFVPGRTFWIFPLLAVAYAISLSPLLGAYFPTFSTILSIFLLTWACVTIGELMLVRGRFGVSATHEFRRAYVRSYNPIGLVPMAGLFVIGSVMASGLLGNMASLLSTPVVGVASLVTPWIIAKVIHRRDPSLVSEKYLARRVVTPPATPEVRECPVSGEKAHRSDFVLCPFHDGKWISSYACLNEKSCHTICQATDLDSGCSSQGVSG